MLLGLADKCRETAPTVVHQLQSLGLECVMLTGDGPGSAKVIKKKVGLSHFVSSMKPNEKYQWLVNKQVTVIYHDLPFNCAHCFHLQG